MIYKEWYLYKKVYLRWIRSKQLKSYLQQIQSGAKPLFIHINRTGGTSITEGLGITAIHYTLAQYEQFWQQKFGHPLPLETPVFTAVRNPFERAVSQYFYRLKHNQNKLASQPLSFSDWLAQVHLEKNPVYRDREIMFMPQAHWIKGSQDYPKKIIRFEELMQDYNRLLKDYHPGELPWKKPSGRPPVSEVLSQADRELLLKVYAVDFKSFNYPAE